MGEESASPLSCASCSAITRSAFSSASKRCTCSTVAASGPEISLSTLREGKGEGGPPSLAPTCFGVLEVTSGEAETAGSAVAGACCCARSRGWAEGSAVMRVEGSLLAGLPSCEQL